MRRKLFSKAALASLLAGIMLSPLVTVAQTKDAKLPVDPKVTIGKLPNGLTYYIRPNNKPEKKVELRLILNAGALQEEDNQQGLAHFMEHMNFNGTKNYPKNKLVDFLQSIGVEFGADLNANTSQDQTIYILPIPTDKPGNLESGFQIIEDWAHNANLTETDINEERNVILEESRLGKGADDRMRKKYLPKLLAGSKYAERDVIGPDDILKNFKPERIRSFYKDWYRPNLMAVAVVGDITVPQAEALIKKHFSGIQNPANARKREEFDVPVFSSPNAMVVTDKEATNYAVQLFFPVRKATPKLTLNDYRNEVIKNLFTAILNRRLQELTRSAAPPFAGAFSGIGELIRGKETLILFSIPSADVQTALNASVGELVKAREFGFTASELEIVKKETLSNIEKTYNERNTTESGALIEEYINNFLEKEPIPGIENEYKYTQEMVPGITLQEVNAVGQNWLNKEYTKNFFALVTGPSDSKQIKVPTDMELKTMVSDALQQKVTANAEKVVAKDLLDKDPVAGKITSEATDTELGVTTYTLSNGIKVSIKKTEFKSDEIVLSAVKKGGDNNYGPEDRANTKYMADVVEAMGYGKFTPTALSDALSGKTVELLPRLGEISAELNGKSSVKDFESLMQLVHLQLTDARKDEALYTGFVSTMKMQIQYMGGNPQIAFIDTLIRTMYNNDPRRPIAVPTAADLEEVKMDRVLEIYKNEFSNADGFHFFIVGNVNESTIKPLLEKYIASLPVKGTQPNFKDNGLRTIKGVNRMNFKKGQDQKSLIITMANGEIPYSEDLALQTDLMGDILSIKVLEDVREQMGAMYSGGFGASLEKNPYSHYSVTGQFPCGPENVEPILKKTDEEIADLKANGPSQKDLDKVKLAKLEKRKEGIKTNNYWASKLEQLLFWDYSKSRFLNFENELNKITATDIKTTANKIFDGKNSFTAVLFPEVIEIKKDTKTQGAGK